MNRQKLVLLVVPGLLLFAGCGGDDTAAENPEVDASTGTDARADQGSTNDVRTNEANDARNDISTPSDVTVGNDVGGGGRDTDAGQPGDAGVDAPGADVTVLGG